MVASGSKPKPLFRVGLAFENARKNVTVMAVKSRLFPFVMIPLVLWGAPGHTAELRVPATQAEDRLGNWSPDEAHILHDWRGDVWTSPVDSGGPAYVLVSVNHSEPRARWAPDGSRLTQQLARSQSRQPLDHRRGALSLLANRHLRAGCASRRH